MKTTFPNAEGVVNQHRRIYLAIALIYLALASCTNNQAEEIKPERPPVAEPPSTTAVTYSNFVQGLMQTKCQGCHGPGAAAAGAFTFNGYASVTANSARIRQTVLVSKTMPKGGSLSPAELESLTKWFDNGMPQQ